MNLIKINCLKIIWLFLTSSAFLLISCEDSKNKVNPEHIKKGQLLFSTVGCATCHSLSADKLYGPPLDSVFKTKVSVVKNGAEHEIIVDRAYLKRSIVEPDFEKPINFQNSKMAKTTLTNHEIDCIVDYLISVNKK
jgi:cytochrome c2